MSADYALRLVIENVGVKESIAELNKVNDGIDKAAAAATKAAPSVDYLGRSLALMQMQALKLNDAFDKGAPKHELHIHNLSRIGNGLAALVGHATGVPPIFERIGDSMAIFAFGHLATVGVLAGFAAIAYAYEKMGEQAREAAKEMDKAVESLLEWKKVQDFGVAGKFGNEVEESTKRLEMQRNHLAALKVILDRPVTGPVIGEGVDQSESFAATERAKIQGQYDRLAKAVEQGEAHVRQVKQKAAGEQASSDIHNLATLVTAHSANAGEIRNATGLLAGLRESLAALAGDGSQSAKRAELIGQIKELGEALHPKDTDKWFALQERQIKGLSLAGELSAGRIGQLKDEATQWRAIADGLDVANPRYERYLALAKAADDLVRKQDTMGNVASWAHDQFAKAFGVPATMSPGDETRTGIIAELTPDPKALADALRYTIAIAVDDVRNSPSVRAMASWEALGKKISEQMSAALGRGLSLGFSKLFSGEGVTGFFKGVTGTLLSALGSMMEEIGGASIGFGQLMTAIRAALKNPITAGPAMIAYGVAMVALGAALNAAGAKMTGGSYGGGSYGSGSSVSAPMPSYLSFGVQAPAPTTSLPAPSAIPHVGPFYVIGPADPKAQRAIAEMVNAATRRGLID